LVSIFLPQPVTSVLILSSAFSTPIISVPRRISTPLVNATSAKAIEVENGSAIDSLGMRIILFLIL